MSLDTLPFNGFDLVLVVVLGLGIYSGRKQGMSGELMPLVKWLAILFVCAAAYEPVGSLFFQTTGIFSNLTCYVMAYVGAALVIVLLFAAVKHSLGGKLVGSDMFGGAEYYLGMASGFVRFACILFVFLAVLNARYFSPAEVKAMEKFQDDVYGSNFFPTLHTLQAEVFEKSLTGPWIRDNLSFLLIKPTKPEGKELHQKEAKWQ
ncbi:MAG TPA: CvpA family protein [Candidatus Dormibacteraeota bacterium]|nr:CvpA family protein [Candidatus Dormibacteraeota bacterium]